MIKSLQILRFIAAASVINYHINFNFGSFGVDIFFVLSGFVISLVTFNNQNNITFIINRISRIVPIYWILSTALLIAAIVAPQLMHQNTIENSNFINFFYSIFFIPFNISGEIEPILLVGWSLNYEMFFYFVVWVSLIITKHPLKISSSVIIFLFVYFAHFSQDSPANSFFGNDIILEFILGLIAFRFYNSNYKKKYNFVFLIIIILLSSSFRVYVENEGIMTSRLLYYGIPSFLIVLSCVFLENYIPKLNSKLISLLVSMGDASYSTYLTHWYVIVFSRKIFSEDLNLYNFHSLMGTIITFVLCLIVGQIIHLFIDNPVNRSFKKYLTSKFL